MMEEHEELESSQASELFEEGVEEESEQSVGATVSQSSRQRRELRLNYREEISEVLKNKKALSKPESDALLHSMAHADDLFSKVSHPREAALDTELLNIHTGLFKEQVNKLHTNFQTHDLPGFVAKAKEYMQARDGAGPSEPHPLDWTRLGKAAHGFFRVTPTLSFMNGPIYVQPRVRQQMRRRQQDRVGEMVSTQTGTGYHEGEADTDHAVVAVASVLRDVREENYFKFVVDPESYSQTVENLFHLSFLVGDGTAEVEVRDKQPVVKFRPPDTAETTVHPRKQCILRFDHAMWEKMSQLALGKAGPVIPHRDYTEQRRARSQAASNGNDGESSELCEDESEELQSSVDDQGAEEEDVGKARGTKRRNAPRVGRKRKNTRPALQELPSNESSPVHS